MSEPKLPSWMNYSDYEDIMHYLRLFGEMKPYYLKAEDVFNAEQEVMKRKIDDGLRLIDVAKEMIWGYKYKERWHQLPKDENMNEFTHTYKFEIQWNTGDEYWDNFPDYDEFEGTIEGLNDYLNSQLDEEDPPACFDKEEWRELMNGETVYDETGARYSVKLVDKVNESLESAKKLLLENGYILEDKYMDDMDDELDTTISFNTIKNIVEKKYKTEIIKNKLCVYPIEDKKNIQIRIESYGRKSGCSIFGVYLVDSNGLTYKVIKNYKYYVSKKNPKCHYLGKDNGYMEEYGGSEEEILKPAEEALTKLNRPGFFKRVGKKINKFVDSFDI